MFNIYIAVVDAVLLNIVCHIIQL